jgi:hypothetical protein
LKAPLQLRVRIADIIGRHAGGRIGIDTDHFRIPLLLCFAASAPRSGRFIMVFDLTLPGFPENYFNFCGFLKSGWIGKIYWSERI